MTIEAPVRKIPSLREVWANPLISAVPGFAVHTGLINAYWKNMTHEAPEPQAVLALADPQRITQTRAPEFRGFIRSLQHSWGSHMDEKQLGAITALADRRLEYLDSWQPLTPRENYRRRQEIQRLAELMVGFVREDMDLPNVAQGNPSHAMRHLYANGTMIYKAYDKAADILGHLPPHSLAGEIDLAEEDFQLTALWGEIKKVTDPRRGGFAYRDTAHVLIQHGRDLSLNDSIMKWASAAANEYRRQHLMAVVDSADDFAVAYQLFRLSDRLAAAGIGLDAIPTGMVDYSQLETRDLFYLGEVFPGTYAIRQEMSRRVTAAGDFSLALSNMEKASGNPLLAAVGFMADVFPEVRQFGGLPDYEDPKIGR